MAAVDPRRLRRHLLLEPVLVLVVAFAGFVAATAIQIWGMDHWGWFEEPCNDIGPGLLACLPPEAQWEWSAFGALVAIGIWLTARAVISRGRR